MRLEFAERLRCPAAHAPTPLIVVARQTLNRDLIEGFAGCPVCHLEAIVTNGDVHFPETSGGRATSAVLQGDDDAARDRLRAQLGLAEGGGAILLTGAYRALANAIALELDVTVICLGGAPSPRAEGVCAVFVSGASVPFTDATFRAAALDLEGAVAEDAVRTVMVGGRVLGAHPLPRPASIQELARDDREWLGERLSGPSGVISLRRA